MHPLNHRDSRRYLGAAGCLPHDLTGFVQRGLPLEDPRLISHHSVVLRRHPIVEELLRDILFGLQAVL